MTTSASPAGDPDAAASASHVLRLGADASAPRTARSFLRGMLGELIDNGLLDDLLVVTSELVTNAVIHAGTPSELQVRVVQGDPGQVEVRLWDGDPRPPVRRALLGGPAAQGRGLVLLSTLTQRWGVDTADGGKTVWAVLSVVPPAVTADG